MDNLYIYERSRSCPDNALRTIQAGKLKGKSDINPVWRIKQLTELFGPCGIGWKLCSVKYWTEPGAAGEVSAWCSLGLMIKVDGAWSDPIEGIGGSMLVTTEKGKLVTNDEAFKMANTDAISVACKNLGFAADVYWDADRTKYSDNNLPASPPPPTPVCHCDRCKQPIEAKKHGGKFYSEAEIIANSQNTFGANLCWTCMKEIRMEQQKAADGQ